MKIRTFILAAAAVVVLAGDGVAQDDAPERCGELPKAVAEKAAAIRAAAAAKDYAALGALADAGEFVYSFGDGGGDPTAYWRELDKGGEDVAGAVAKVLDMPCVVMTYEEMVEYVWPAAHGVPYYDLTEAEKAKLGTLYPGQDPNFYYLEGPDVGYYVGWRLFIGEAGDWTGFVAGD